ncbi:molybdopterin guanine dinucleotide synthesis [Paracoccus liaowanqingii]|uniref:Molybdopterin guanine dinucleotide synthesis n=1 Tax=Paracoccus liaowanqingii TaxID=2560053 RepID=A0A4V1BJB8_9RHOB|nr:molybdopterin guanine dinucleotide synthesis [Paracoccus liaowanqingii]QBX35742.1 molybdopterin guanine dinucleotide synthesis [Paracoccus liaowanqingii]
MPRFDRILILDWSAAGLPVRGANSIWLGDDRGMLANPATRAQAAALLDAAVAQARDAGTRLLIGADFAFGHPSGLALRITGRPEALALWDHLEAHHHDDDANRSSYRAVASGMNATLGTPVFWGDGRRTATPGLPRLKPPPHPTLAPHRATEAPSPGGPRPKSPFQLAGAGAVGAQSLTGIPRLNRLRRQPGVAVWPFQPCHDAMVVLAEVYPSMIAPEVRAARGYPCLDAAQVGLLARSLRHLDGRDALAAMMAPDPRIADLASEGQILGFGHAPALRAAARAVLPPP